MRIPVVLLCLLLPLAAGCLDDEAAPQGEPVADELLFGAPHGEARMEESDVEVQMDLARGGWVATRTVTFANGVAGVASAHVQVSNGPGGIDASGVDAVEYQTVVDFEARGATEAQARDLLATMSVVHADRLDGDRLELATEVHYEDVDPFLGILGGFQQRSATVQALLPGHLPYDLSLDVGSGQAVARGLSGTTLAIGAGSGDVAAQETQFMTTTMDVGSGTVSVEDARGSVLVAGAGSGDLRIAGAFDNVMTDTGSGSQELVLSAQASGNYDFSAGSGSISVQVVRAPDQAFDVTARTGSGEADVQVSDGETVGAADEDEVHVRSRGFSAAAVQTVVRMETGSGDVQFTD